MNPMCTTALFAVAKAWKQPKCSSTEERVEKSRSIHPMGCYSAVKRSEIMPFAATWVALKRVILSEVNQTEKEKYRMISLMNLLTKRKQTRLQENKLIVTGVGKGGDKG